MSKACDRPSARKAKRFNDARLQAVSSRNMYSEHGFDARIAPSFGQVCQALIVSWNCRPGSAAGPGGVADLVPQIARLERFSRRRAGRCGADQIVQSANPRQRRRKKSVGHAHGVVGVLPGDREIRLAESQSVS